jgi:hypothetical protein
LEDGEETGASLSIKTPNPRVGHGCSRAPSTGHGLKRSPEDPGFIRGDASRAVTLVRQVCFFLIFCGLIVQLGRLGRSLESGDPELRDIDIKPQEKDGRRAGTGIGAELQGGCTAARGENGISGERC